MSQDLTRADVERQLEEKRAHMLSRLDALQAEATGVGRMAEGYVETAKSYVTQNPYLVAGGAVAALVLVGGLLSRGRKKKHLGASGDLHRLITDQYIGVLSAEVQHSIQNGMSPAEAVRAALHGRAPVVVVPGASAAAQRKGLLHEALDMAISAGLGFAVRTAMDWVAGRFQVENALADSASEGFGSERY